MASISRSSTDDFNSPLENSKTSTTRDEIFLNNIAILNDGNKNNQLKINSQGLLIHLTLIERIWIFFFDRTTTDKRMMTEAFIEICNGLGRQLKACDRNNLTNLQKTTQNTVFNMLKNFYGQEFSKFFIAVMVGATLDNATEINKAFAEAVYCNKKGLDRKITEAKLALLCKIEPESCKGTTGTVFLRGLDGKRIGVYKRATDELPLLTRIPLLIKSLTWGQLSFLKAGPDVQCKAEVAAFIVSRYFKFNFAPECKFLSGEDSINGYSRGTFMEYIEDHSDAQTEEDVFNQQMNCNSEDLSPSTDETRLLQRFFIFDFLIGNLDRHMENWFVKFERDDPTKNRPVLKVIKAIDNGNAFPVKNPKKSPLANQLKWADLPVANLPFTDKIKKKINHITKEGKIDICLAQIEKELPGFMNDAMKKGMHQRAAVLRHLASQEHSNPKQLRGYVTDAAIKAVTKTIQTPLKASA